MLAGPRVFPVVMHATLRFFDTGLSTLAFESSSESMLLLMYSLLLLMLNLATDLDEPDMELKLDAAL